MHIADIVAVATPFLTILFLLFVGVVMRRRGMVTLAGARQMTGLVLNVSLPPLIFVTLAVEITPPELGRAPLLVAMGLLGPIMGYLLSGAVARLPLFRPPQRATFQTAVAVTNTAFVGYPLCEALLGSTGLLYAVLYDVGLTVVMSTLSIWLLIRASRRGDNGPGQPLRSGSGLRELLRTPMMWALLVGAAWGALSLPTPDWLIRPLRTLGQCTTPLALLAVGMLVQPVAPGARPLSPARGAARPFGAEAERSSAPPAGAGGTWPQLAVLAAIRLLLAPALMAGLVLLLRVERTAAAVIVLQTAVPSAVCSTAMVEQYGGDGAFAAAGVVTTTLLSLLTLPLWSVLMLAR